MLQIFCTNFPVEVVYAKKIIQLFLDSNSLNSNCWYTDVKSSNKVKYAFILSGYGNQYIIDTITLE